MTFEQWARSLSESDMGHLSDMMVDYEESLGHDDETRPETDRVSAVLTDLERLIGEAREVTS